MKNYYKSIIICYTAAIITLVIMFAISYAMLRSISPQVLGLANITSAIISVIIVGIAAYLSCRYTSHSRENLKYRLKRIASFALLMALVGFAISFLGGFIVSYAVDFLTILRIDDFQLFCTVVKIPLFIGFIIFLALLSYRTGADDAAVKSFNPHLMLTVLIFAFAFMMPATVSDHMYGHSEAIGGVDTSNPSARQGASDPGKIIYNVQTVFSSNIDLYRDYDTRTVNERFSASWVVISILLSMAAQIFAAMAAYNIGRIRYEKSRPSRKAGGGDI